MPESIDEAAITNYIAAISPAVDVELKDEDRFFIYDPERSFKGVQRIPFATLVTRDEYETVSNLDRPGIFRLNIGASKASYLDLFGAEPPRPTEGWIIDSGFDYTTLDLIMPHPVYAHMHWICVLNPSVATFEKLKPMLTEAYQLAERRISKRAENRA